MYFLKFLFKDMPCNMLLSNCQLIKQSGTETKQEPNP